MQQVPKAAYDYADEKLKDYKTPCCNALPYRKSRANLRCKKCDADVTLDMVLLSQMFTEEFKTNNSGTK